jgi:hypothetical protein
MEEILTALHQNLSDAFINLLKPKDLNSFPENESIDVLNTLMNLKKNKNVINELMLKGAVSVEELIYTYGEQSFKKCLENKYIIKCNSINNDKVFIGTYGLYTLYSLKGFKTDYVFNTYDKQNFETERKLVLKAQEKIWCIFLILFGSDKKESSLDTENFSNAQLMKYHNFFKIIENEIIKNKINLGKKIGWETGKDKVFRKFITNNVDLPRTSLYHNVNKYKYYLDLSSKKKAKYLLDLILDKYHGEERLLINDVFYNVLKDLSDKISIELYEIPADINRFLIEELKA